MKDISTLVSILGGFVANYHNQICCDVAQLTSSYRVALILNNSPCIIKGANVRSSFPLHHRLGAAVKHN